MVCYSDFHRSQKGFSLIEVLIALVVVVVGILGVVMLQGVFLQSVSDSSRRSVAIMVAEKQIENLRHFDGISSGSVATYDSIPSAATGTVAHDGQDYDWSYITTETIVSGASGGGSMKELLLTVSWGDDANESLQVSSIIGAISPGFTPLFGTDGTGGGTPDVTHNPGQTPDVIPITVGNGLEKETSKPLPEVSQHGTSNQINFEVVTYATNNNNKKEIREDFLTVNCTCEFGLDSSLTGSGATPAFYSWDEVALERSVNKGDTVVKVVGENKLNEQDRVCDRCCRDHHDNIAASFAVPASTAYDPWRDPSHYTDAGGAGWDHNHYASGGVVVVPPVTGSEYVEACRFKRINGVYELMQDWRLVDINVMSRDELAASNAQSVYEQYVQTLVAEYVNGSFDIEDYIASTALPNVDFENFTSSALSTNITVAPGSQTQLLSRSIYMEPMDDAHKAYLVSVAGGTVSTGDPSWLETVPFYEINTTLLTDWTESLAASSSDLSVTDEDIVTIVDPSRDYYGTYSRGVVIAENTASTSTAAFYSESELSNTGLTDSPLIDPDDAVTTDDFINVTLDGDSTIKFFSGVFDCANNNNNGNKCDDQDYEDLTVVMLGSPAGGVCSITELTGGRRGYSCQYVAPTAAGTFDGSIAITYNGAYTTIFSTTASILPITGAAGTGSFTWTIPTPGVGASSDMDVIVTIN